jgi:glycosyltransferase involved in cell wall biosynthesis
MRQVDVVIPCYRYGRYLRACVQSVLAQEGVGVRVLVIDDCSPDDTPAVGRALAAEDPRVEYRRHAQNRGHIRTYNEGLLGWASADFTLLLSADDLLTPGCLARAVNLMEAHPEVGMVHGRFLELMDDDPPPPPRAEGRPTWRVVAGPQFVEETCTTAQNSVVTPTALVRTALQQEIGGYREELPHAGDLEMWLRFAARGAVGYVDADQAYYRRHRRNMGFQYCGLNNYYQLQATFDLFFGADAGLLAEPERLRRLSDRALARQALWVGSHALDRGDEATYLRCLEVALEQDPSVRRDRTWWRLRVKRLLGRRCWSVVSPAVYWLRGKAPQVPDMPPA